MGEGPHGWLRWRENGTSSYLGAKRDCWLSAEDHLGEKIYPIYVTHRWWVTSGSIWDMISREKVGDATRTGSHENTNNLLGTVDLFPLIAFLL